MNSFSSTQIRRGLLGAVAAITVSSATAGTAWFAAADLWSQSVALEKQSDYQGALQKMPAFLQASGDEYLAALRSGWLSFLNQKYDDAAQSYQRASRLAPDAINPLLGLASAYLSLQKYSEAARVYEQLATRRVSNATSLAMLGAMSFQSRDYRHAVQYYGSLLQSYPEDATALSGFAWASFYQGNKIDAVSAFRRLLLLSPNYQDAQRGYEMASGAKLAVARR